MAKRKRINYRKDLSLNALPLDLRAMADEPVEAIQARAGAAAQAALAAFDLGASGKFVFYGPQSAPMHTTVKSSKKGVTIICIVSDRPVRTKYLAVSPTLTRDTTGRNRQAITVSGRIGQSVEVPNGFVWSHSIWRRISGYHEGKDGKVRSNITSARPWLVNAGANPSPANVLAATENEVTGAVTELLLRAIDDAGKDSK